MSSSRRAQCGFRIRSGIYVPTSTPEEETVPEKPLASDQSSPIGRMHFTDMYAERLYRLRERRLSNAPPRPVTAADVIGQSEAPATLEALLSSAAPCHMLLIGPPGTGKTTTARVALDLVKNAENGVFEPDAPFVQVDGATLSNDVGNKISGMQSLLNEAFYSNVRARNERVGLHPDTPEIRLGPMARAHLGILFCDEIGELHPANQTALLTVLEEGRETLPQRAETGGWMLDPRTPKWMSSFMRSGIPASFILIGATTRDPKSLDQALVSRCEIVRFRTLDWADRREIARRSSENFNVPFAEPTLDRIADFSTSGREAARRVVLAFAAARRRNSDIVEPCDVPGEKRERRTGFRP